MTMAISSEPVIIVDRIADWKTILSRKPFKQLLDELNRKFPKSISLILDYRDIQAAGKLGLDLADEILDYPNKVIDDIRDCIWYNSFIKGNDDEKKLLKIRFVHLPRKTQIRDIRAEHIGKMISVEGIIRKVSEVRPRLTLGVFRCKTGHRTVKPQGFGPMIEPDSCGADGCTNRRFELLPPPHSEFIDSQKMKLQETPEALRGGEQPQSIECDVTADLVGLYFPGARVIITGIVKQFQRQSYGKASTTFDVYLEVNSVEPLEEDYEEIEISEEDELEIKALAQTQPVFNDAWGVVEPGVFGKIARSIAPSIFGMDDIKKALALQMFGGIQKLLPDGTVIRGDSHVLLIGDPGIAKSQMIRYVVWLVPRSVFTSGKSATAAGLTATAVKDEFDGKWTLEAGAAVMADKGILGLDEMDKIDKSAHSSLHEAMEQQSISVAKAGICASLQCRFSLLGAANPVLGRFDDYTALSEQFNMPPSLLSRFDLIFVMTDKPEATRDRMLAQHILNTHLYVEELERSKRENRQPGIVNQSVIPEIPPALLRKYIAYAKANVFPKMTPEAMAKFEEYFTSIRSQATGTDKPVPVTARNLEALIRLGEAAARLSLSETVTEEHASLVISIVDMSLRQVAYDPKTGTFDIDKVVSSTSKSQREIIIAIDKAYDEMKNEFGLAYEADIVTRLGESGFPRMEVGNVIEKMKRDCHFIEKKTGQIKRL